MPQQRLYYEDVDGKVIPYWYVLTFRPGEIDWDKDFYFYTPIAPFEFFERDEFDDEVVSASIYAADFIRKGHQLGINLKLVKKRIDQYGVDPYVVRQLIVQIPDIEEVLSYLPNKRTKSFMMMR
ncbi:hypothetical protein JOC86_002337 [Bacillus pakistanensis]|uniref:Uncharacterized protein n=1 Tax=Rossellomorea pakistanensis TaxID=992288 RepID=A0ABS2ND77_9BACI|nr:hypothetical protein [Bacillus pakistanensis]MBM7585795.1 hypothetical protein [Bacillus pakistanensis]